MKAVIYARYSSHAQNEQSIEGQLHDCHAYAERFGLTVIGEYIDRAIPGKTDDRPSFQRMISDAAKLAFDRIIVWKTDRFARNRYDSAIYKHQLKKYSVRVISAMENIGEGDESILVEAMLEAMAEYYSLDLKKKVTRGLRESISKKQYSGGSIPYGYKVVDKHIVIDEDTAPTVRFIFEQYGSGVPMKRIIEQLSERGIRGRLGGKLTYTTFSRTLTNTAYIGQYIYSGQIIEGMVEPIIEEDLFYKVQQMVKKKAQKPAAAKAKVDYILSGKVFCGHCGEPMTGEYGKGRHGATYYYYTCSGRKRKHNCLKKNERKETLQQYVLTQTLTYVLQQGRLEHIADSIVSEYESSADNSSIQQLERRKSSISREINNLIDSLADAPKVAHQRIYTKLQQLDAESAAIDSDLDKLRISAAIRPTRSSVLSWLRSFTTGDPSDPSFTHNIIDSFVNSVYIYDDRILIFYNLRHTTTPTPPLPVSDFISSSPHLDIKSETEPIIFDTVFGLRFHR